MTPGWADDPVRRQDGRRRLGTGHRMVGGEGGAVSIIARKNKQRSLGK